MRNLDNVKKLRLLDRDIALLTQQVSSEGRYEGAVFAPSESNKKRVEAEQKAILKRIDAVDTSDPVAKLLAEHFKGYIEAGKAGLETYFESPGRAFNWLSESMLKTVGGDYRPEKERAEVFEAKMQSADILWHDGILPVIKDLPSVKLQQVLKGLEHAIELIDYTKPKIKDRFGTLPASQLNKLFTGLDTYAEKINSYIADTKKVFDEKGSVPKTEALADSDVVQITHEEYKRTLENTIGVKLDEILSWHEEENAKTRAEALEIARKIDIPEAKSVRTMKDVSDILWKYAGPCDSPEEMFRRVNLYLKRARSAAHDYIWLPENEICECVNVPEQLKDSYPWGGYSSDWPSRYPLYNVMFLNDYNYTAVTDGWIKINALHEAYPGHHCQFVRAMIDPIPETFKKGIKHIPFIEGVCIRTERVFEHVFPEDPFYPLMVAHRRHHTSTRIKIDLMLHYFGKTIGDACDLYEKEMGFNRKTARAQVQAHENMTGYFTGYYYGMKKITDWEKEFGWDKRDYTELLFSVGRISMDTLRNILELSDQGRHSLLHDYSSMLQFV